jgi:GMP synthase (glutamine-hydrolysing)
MTRPVLIMKTGETLAALRARGEDFENWIGTGLGLSPTQWCVSHVALGQALPQVESVAGVVITGSPAMLTDGAPWNGLAAQWLRVVLAYELPVLGICYGHQLLAHACGGHVDYHPLGREIGTVPVTLAPAARDDVLLGALPGCFVAQTTHSQSVLLLPPAATLLASSAHDGHQAYRVGARAWGVQFHPEFSAAVMRTYVRERQQALQAEGFDVDALLRGVQETPAANGILRRFAALCGY